MSSQHPKYRTVRLTRYHEIERRSLAGLALDPDPSAMPFDDLLAYRQANGGAGILVPRVKSLEHLEQLVVILRRYADAVVLDGEHGIIASRP
jgi:hypothetical protein